MHCKYNEKKAGDNLFTWTSRAALPWWGGRAGPPFTAPGGGTCPRAAIKLAVDTDALEAGVGVPVGAPRVAVCVLHSRVFAN